MVLADSEAVGNQFDDKVILDLKHRLLDRVDLTVSCKLLTTDGRSHLDCIMEGLLQGFVTDENDNQYIV